MDLIGQMVNVGWLSRTIMIARLGTLNPVPGIEVIFLSSKRSVE